MSLLVSQRVQTCLNLCNAQLACVCAVAAAMPHRCGHSISGVQQRQQTLLSEFQEKMYAQDAKESFKVSM